MSRQLNSLISKIRNDKMNSICFDCNDENPAFISINNGIFLCNQCATVHMSFQPGISTIENNDLYSLTENELNFLVKGGNTRLNDFILDEFPKLENYSQKLLYKTRAMDYYRKRLDFFVNGGVEPKRPSQIIGCQLIPENFYSKNSYVRKDPMKFEAKTRTYKPNPNNLRQRNNEFDDDEDEDNFFNDPFMNESKFGMNEGNMFKKFFGNDFFGFDDDEFFGPKKKINQTQIFKETPKYQERPKTVYNTNTTTTNTREPQDNMSRRKNPEINDQKPQKRPLTSNHPIFVPSRKHKYIKKENQINNNNNNNNSNNNIGKNVQKEMKEFPKNISTNNYEVKNKEENKKYDPFKRRDSTELITLPGMENNNLSQNKKIPKKQEIPSEFHKQATGLGQITDAINENDELSFSESEGNSNSEKDSSEELAKIPENNTHKDKDVFDESQITFKNSIRNKYKKRKSEQLEKLKNEEKLKNKKSKNNNVYESKYSKNSNSGKKEGKNNQKHGNTGFNNKKDSKNETNPQFDKKFVRRLSKIKITSTNWNINQLGDMNIYPDAMEVEG